MRWWYTSACKKCETVRFHGIGRCERNPSHEEAKSSEGYVEGADFCQVCNGRRGVVKKHTPEGTLRVS